MKQLLYFSVKVFFHSILSIFFRDVEIIGRQNIPQYGPIIFTSNHANQFIDSVVMLTTCQRTVSYLVAEKSWKRRIIGDIAWAMGAVPVKRAQDSAKKGSGEITLEEEELANKENANVKKTCHVRGINTKFSSEIKRDDKIRIPGSPMGFKVTKIDSDTSMFVDCSDLPADFKLSSTPFPYDILMKIDQKEVYEMVLNKLASGGTLGIFPEGGSHDQTDLLPLKAGIALIAYSALEKDGLAIPIVPVGLNYFRGHRFRGRVIVEYGRPTYLDPSTLDDYKKGGPERRKVCNEFLER